MWGDIPEPYRNQIVTGDALDLLRTLPDESVPLFLFSPPYNMGVSTGGGVRQYKSHYDPNSKMGKRGGNGKWKGAALADGYEAHDDAMEWSAYAAWQHQVLRECWRCLSPSGAIFYNHKPRILSGVCHTPLEYVPDGLTLRQIIIWQRAGSINFTHRFYAPMHEWVMVLAKLDFCIRDKAASGVGDVCHVPQKSRTWHPAPFPFKLAKRVLETTRPTFVCDPFIGSGTTAKAAKALGIGYIGFEKSATYAERARREIANTASALVTQQEFLS